MSGERIYAVLLADGADDELGKAFNSLVRRSDQDAYILAQSADPEPDYLRMTVRAGPAVELEVRIPHEYVRAVLYGTDNDLANLGIS